jgi:Raf kinase inhibitor-like YbhB/YbcL family protein
MPTRRNLLGGAVAIALAGCSEDRIDPGEEGSEEFEADLPAFGATVDEAYTCDGEDVSPPIELEGVPVEAESLAVVVEDPDAPSDDPFVHWLLWNVPAETTEIPEGIPARRPPRRSTAPPRGPPTSARSATGALPADGRRRTPLPVHRPRARRDALAGTGRRPRRLRIHDEGHAVEEATVTADYER